jgi:hypothetical protein
MYIFLLRQLIFDKFDKILWTFIKIKGYRGFLRIETELVQKL